MSGWELENIRRRHDDHVRECAALTDCCSSVNDVPVLINEILRLRGVIDGLSVRVADQSELLTRRS